MYTLGINAAFHDSAAALVKDGDVVAAVEEERLTHVKHGKRPLPFTAWELPFHAIDCCLEMAGITLADVDHVAYSYNPYQRIERHRHDALVLPLEPSAAAVDERWETPWDALFISYVINAPRQLVDGAPHHLKKRFKGVSLDGPYRWHYVDHHLCHAVSAFFCSPFEEAAVMTLDGRGERTTTSYLTGRGCDLHRIGEVWMPHSIGLLYERITDYLGFLHSSDEYKVMALASYGGPRYLEEFREILQVGDGGRYTVKDVPLEQLFGPPRERGAPLTPRHFDIAHSLQAATEEAVFTLADWLHAATGLDDLCLAGGVALNCVINGRLRRRGPFRRLWVQPAAGDAGTALGAALWTDAVQRGDQRRRYTMDHAFLGPEYGDDRIEEFLRWTKVPYRRSDNVAEEAAALLAQDKIIGWYQGRMEFGPRALGGRSILASPLRASMQARLNNIKDREDFRPVAPVVLEEEAPRWFRGGEAAPFMLLVYDVLPEAAARIPAVRHIDGTARVQTINRGQHPRYYDLLKAFQRLTGVPVLINTSFNTRGEPIVCTPRDAVECFWTSPIDALVAGSFILEKSGSAADDKDVRRRSDLQASGPAEPLSGRSRASSV